MEWVSSKYEEGRRRCFVFSWQRLDLEEVRGFLAKSKEVKEDENGVTVSDTGLLIVCVTI